MANPVPGLEKAIMSRPRKYQSLPAPADLGDEARAVWRRVVEARPIDFYDGADVDALARYCRIEVRLRDLERRMDDGEEGLHSEYADFLRLSLALARALRILKSGVVAPGGALNRRRSAHREWPEGE
ncbi:MAG TPA: hypothetical protein PLQ12_08665 [Candidatus Defluviicoccus seviourii]|nr:hypothetical protein [Candidatus Defluviicoccus seviourii]